MDTKHYSQGFLIIFLVVVVKKLQVQDTDMFTVAKYCIADRTGIFFKDTNAISLLDRCLPQFVFGGVQYSNRSVNVVALGAGYDTRSYRFAPLYKATVTTMKWMRLERKSVRRRR